MTLIQRFIYWLPRIICILAISFVSIFALDAYDQNLGVWKQIQEFAMHLIPSFILLLILLIAWKWELIGGIVFLIIGIGLSPLIYMHNYRMNGSVWMSLWVIITITFPFILVGVLFVIGHLKYEKNDKAID